MQTIALGVDGMEPSLCDKWVAEGELPNIERLRTEGSFGRANCSSLVSARQWVTHFTGVSAKRHGVSGFVRTDEVAHERDANPFTRESPDARTLINLEDIKAMTYPEYLTDLGKRVGLINPLPIWPPLELDGGFCISGMVTPPTAERIAYPSEVEEELVEFGYRVDVLYNGRPYGFVDDRLLQDDGVGFETLRTDMFDVLDARIQYTKHAVETKDVDVLFSLLKSVDIIQHAFWIHMEEDIEPFEDCILECYSRVDELIGWIRDSHPGTNLLLFSDHGFGPRLDPKSGSLHSIGYLVDSYVSIPYRLKSFYYRYLKSEVAVDETAVDRLTGDHRSPGVWMMCGPDIRNTEKYDVAFEDLTPTLLTLTGTPIPDTYVGDPLKQSLTREVNYDEIDIDPPERPRWGVDEEVSERLYDLGYADMVENSG